MTRRGWVLFASMSLIWGIPYLLIKVAVDDVTPASLVFLRTGIGAMLLLPIAVRRGAIAPLWSRWRWVIAYTAIEVALPFDLVVEVGPVRATVITYLNPAVALTLGVLVLNEPLTMHLAAGFVLIIMGSILATQPSLTTRATGPMPPGERPQPMA